MSLMILENLQNEPQIFLRDFNFSSKISPNNS